MPQDILISLDNLDVFHQEMDESVDAKIASIVPMVETTWAALKALRDGGNLVPGMQYRITDYQCTTITSSTSSAGHQFDIIVVADSANKLNAKARAILHAGDTYFANSNLDAWELWYCLDNDTTRFDWADSTNGKGVIYRMIDEFNNDVPYDFKNILFNDIHSNAYTFSYTASGVVMDASLLGVSKRCYGNVIKNYIEFNKQQLNFNVFYSTNTSFDCFSNIFKDNCCHNTFENKCQKNTFGNACNYNTFGDYLYYNTFGNSCNSNTFGDSCRNNIFGNFCNNNKFGDDCEHNTFGNSCSENTFGNNCVYNTFGACCQCNKFGDSSSAINYCRYNIVDNGCQYLYIVGNGGTASSSNQLQNIHVHLGVCGTSSSNRKTITVDRNLNYETNVYQDVNGNIEMLVNSGIISAINANY